MSGGPLLVALVAGDAAIRFEMMSPVESVKRVLGILKDIFNPKGIRYLIPFRQSVLTGGRITIPMDPTLMLQLDVQEMIMISFQRVLEMAECSLLERQRVNSFLQQCMELYLVG